MTSIKRVIAINLAIIMIIALCSLNNSVNQINKKLNKSYSVESSKVNESINQIINVDTYDEDHQIGDTTYYIEYPESTYNKSLNKEDRYLLAKIAMAEAEGCNIQTKVFVILVVLNRVQSDKFPDTIYEVIFEKNQFSPIKDGRWNKVEPNEECWEAVEIAIKYEYDYSEGALYFESCKNENNWHSRNLEYLYQIDSMRFYK